MRHKNTSSEVDVANILINLSNNLQPIDHIPHKPIKTYENVVDGIAIEDYVTYLYSYQIALIQFLKQ